MNTHKKAKRKIIDPGEVLAINKPNLKWLKTQLFMNGVTQREVAKALDLHPTAINHVLTGHRKLKESEMRVVSRLLGMEFQEFLDGLNRSADAPLEGFGLSNPGETLEITGWIDGYLNVHNGLPQAGKAFAEPFTGAVKAASVLRAQTAGSQFDGIDGALVYFYPSDRVEADVVGRMAIVSYRGLDGVLKSALRVVKRGYSQGKYNLVLLNGVMAESDCQLIAAAPVLWMKL